MPGLAQASGYETYHPQTKQAYGSGFAPFSHIVLEAIPRATFYSTHDVALVGFLGEPYQIVLLRFMSRNETTPEHNTAEDQDVHPRG